jgi:hypothetical protein
MVNVKSKVDSTSDVDNDEYNDVLLVEVAIKNLKTFETLSEDDIALIEFVKNGGQFSNEDNDIEGKRRSLSKKYTELCDRIAFYMGGYFTDEGYLEYMQKKHNWTTEQIDRARVFIKSQFKNKIIRKLQKVTKETNE